MSHSKHVFGTLEERFWPKVDKTPGHGPNGDCWLWTGGIAGPDYKKPGGGYGKINNGKGSIVSAHRIAWLIATGKEATFPVLHRCDIRLCVNPAHLFLGTVAENNEDMRQKGRKWTKLKPDQVRSIRERLEHGEQGTVLAKEFGVSAGLICHIHTRRIWTHVS